MDPIKIIVTVEGGCVTFVQTDLLGGYLTVHVVDLDQRNDGPDGEKFFSDRLRAAGLPDTFHEDPNVPGLRQIWP